MIIRLNRWKLGQPTIRAIKPYVLNGLGCAQMLSQHLIDISTPQKVFVLA